MTMTTELTKAAQQALEACPFCGGQPEGCDFDGRGNYISCPSCGIDGPDGGGYGGGRSGAITAWNTRAQRPAAQTDQQWQETAAALNHYAHNGKWPDERPAVQTLSHDETHDWGDRIAKLQRPASLPAPQQATPAQDVGASADYWGDLAQQKADADARRGVSMPVSYYTSSIVGALLATQQATPARLTPDQVDSMMPKPDRDEPQAKKKYTYSDMRHLAANIQDYFASAQQATPEPLHLFEFWWESHMPQATQSQAWAAWTAAQNSKGATIDAAQATPDVPETGFGNMATQQAAGEPVGEPFGYFVTSAFYGTCAFSKSKPSDLDGDSEIVEVYTRPAPGVPEVLFDGFAVLKALTPQAERRTSAENVSDVLDAVVRLIRADAAQAKEGAHG